ncbi:hypothetical protein [Methanoregula sp.]|jgi:hypothetical protein|uniref:hypothetical protein n=1 Tax=Methanoregula sp. TaxID=2052170 RepID=UPI003C28040B
MTKISDALKNITNTEWALIGIAVTIICTIVGLTIHPFYFSDSTVVAPTQTPTPINTAIPTPVQTSEPIVSIIGVNYRYSWNTPHFLPYSKDYWYTSDQGALTTNTGETFTYDITFTSHAWTLSHSIESITIGTNGFTLERIDPPIPSELVTTGSSITEKLTIQAPNSAYNGPLEINVISQ